MGAQPIPGVGQPGGGFEFRGVGVRQESGNENGSEQLGREAAAGRGYR